MTQQVIGLGTAPNDGTGDQDRIAFGKCNSNFTELYGKSIVTGTNTAIVAVGPSNNVIDGTTLSSVLYSGINSTKVIAYGTGSTSSATTGQIWNKYTVTGTSTDTGTFAIYNLYQCNGDNLDGSGATNGVIHHYWNAVGGGANFKKGRILGQFELNINAAPADVGNDYTPVVIYGHTNQSFGGTAGVAGARGNLYGLNVKASTFGAATNISGIRGIEVGVSREGTSSSNTMRALSLIMNGSSTIAPQVVDTAIEIVAGSASGATGWNYLMTDGGYDSFPSLKLSTGWWFGCWGHGSAVPSAPGAGGTIAGFADLSNYTAISDSIIKGPAGTYKIDGSFNVIANTLSAAAGTTARAPLKLAPGVAPTSPADGDIWYDGTNIKMRIGATTKTFTLT